MCFNIFLIIHFNLFFRKLKSEITDLEAEIVRLQKKCENLESLVQAKDNTPRRTELCKRIIHESPAPELTVTPSLDKVHEVKSIIYLTEQFLSLIIFLIRKLVVLVKSLTLIY